MIGSSEESFVSLAELESLSVTVSFLSSVLFLEGLGLGLGLYVLALLIKYLTSLSKACILYPISSNSKTGLTLSANFFCSASVFVFHS